MGARSIGYFLKVLCQQRQHIIECIAFPAIQRQTQGFQGISEVIPDFVLCVVQKSLKNQVLTRLELGNKFTLEVDQSFEQLRLVDDDADY